MSVSTEITRIQGAKNDIASAIENKGVIVPVNTKIDGMAALIDQIEQAEKDKADENDVIFIDYDGTILYSYTANKFALLEELPPNPTKEDLTAQGWNWTLSDAKDYVAVCGGLVIGQNYITSDGKTHVWIHLDEEHHTPFLGLGVNGTVTIEWGDESPNSTLTGTAFTVPKYTQAPYQHGGDYEIKISLTRGSGYRILGNGSLGGSVLLTNSVNSEEQNYSYLSCIYKVEMGSDCRLRNYAFSGCTELETISLSTESIVNKGSVFRTCVKLKAAVLSMPSATEGGYSFRYAANLKYVSLPHNYGVIGTYAFYKCINLKRIHLVPTTTEYPAYNILDLVSLKHIVIPPEVTSFGSNSFYGLVSIKKIRFLGTTPPNMGSNSFNYLSRNCIISVPVGSLSAYTSADNYPDPDTYTYIEE